MFNSLEERVKDFLSLWDKYTDEDSDYLVKDNKKLIDYLTKEGFFTAPASTKYHGAYEGGLYDHSKAVFLRLKELTDKLGLEWQRPESPFIVGMFHDLCKCDQYKKVEGRKTMIGDQEITVMDGYHYEYNTNTLLKGHGTKSVMILSQFINLTQEEMLCIRYHMGPYEKEEWTEFDNAVHVWPNVYYTNSADIIASKIDGI